ncbi:endonuclease/exonuclease/phosphatase family protein [Mycolicibacterium arenosum]|uniref:Endonuclease/exonuclease/phosphatase family protein n=1 Tax=Mycolicibacterium arenosum TaxID=2952157 RepID=A0ABT1M720_9MYCO|nr:endonuclease/exonuclease/phosphatase family protein [Mycolicibacterium sp. CAU 1645]MCP9274217.1 endonuclease/exonuclease/phosphatase family protein [Mycolicibacterium sp. CAU 1645]
MRVATFNILHGRDLRRDVVDIDAFADCIRDIDADVLALQEVDVDQPRSGMADLTAVAGAAMGAVSQRFVAAISGTPGATWMAATGTTQPGTAAYGIALLSRFPVSSWQVIRLPHIRARFPMYLPGARKVLIVHEEPRAAVIARLETPEGSVTVANTHLSFVPGWNRTQLRRITRDLRLLPGPRVLVGDLNMTPTAVRRWSGMRALGGAATFPVDRPDRQLDHILTDDTGLRATAVDAPALPISDHRPLIVDVTRDG